MDRAVTFTMKEFLVHMWNVLCLKTGKRISVGEYLCVSFFLGVIVSLLSWTVFFLHLKLVGDIVVSVISLTVSIVFLLRRLADLDKHWTHVFFLLIPFYNIFWSFKVSFTKGTVGANRYGEDSLEHQPTSNTWYHVFGWLFFVLYMGSSLILSNLQMATINVKGQAYYDSCITKYENDNLTGALADCNMAIGLGVKTADSYLSRCVLNVESEDYTGGIADCTQSLSLDFTFVDSYIFRGTSKMFLHDYTGSLTDLDTAVNLDPKNPTSYFYRALLYISLDQAKDACADLVKTRALGGDLASSEVEDYFKQSCK